MNQAIEYNSVIPDAATMKNRIEDKLGSESEKIYSRVMDEILERINKARELPFDIKVTFPPDTYSVQAIRIAQSRIGQFFIGKGYKIKISFSIGKSSVIGGIPYDEIAVTLNVD